MKKTRHVTAMFVVLALSIMFGGVAKVSAAENIGSVVALKGTAVIERDAKAIEAKVKDGIQLKDTVETKVSSKTKMLFIDDSVLTMGEKAKVVIKEFVYSKDKGGKSIFNLIDGKMRSVVGKAAFEVHTPTAVAAARGTVFDCEAGDRSGKQFTTCTCYEGVVDISSADPTISGRVSLRQGMTVTVVSGLPVPAPTPAPASTLRTGATVSEATLRESAVEVKEAAAGLDIKQVLTNPVITNQIPPSEIIQQPKTTTPVNVGIGFPGR